MNINLFVIIKNRIRIKETMIENEVPVIRRIQLCQLVARLHKFIIEVIIGISIYNEVKDLDYFSLRLLLNPVTAHYAEVIRWLLPAVQSLIVVLLLCTITFGLRAAIGLYGLYILYVVCVSVQYSYIDIPCPCVLEHTPAIIHILLLLTCIHISWISLCYYRRADRLKIMLNNFIADAGNKDEADTITQAAIVSRGNKNVV